MGLNSLPLSPSICSAEVAAAPMPHAAAYAALGRGKRMNVLQTSFFSSTSFIQQPRKRFPSRARPCRQLVIRSFHSRNFCGCSSAYGVVNSSRSWKERLLRRAADNCLPVTFRRYYQRSSHRRDTEPDEGRDARRMLNCGPLPCQRDGVRDSAMEVNEVCQNSQVTKSLFRHDNSRSCHSNVQTEDMKTSRNSPSAIQFRVGRRMLLAAAYVGFSVSSLPPKTHAEDSFPKSSANKGGLWFLGDSPASPSSPEMGKGSRVYDAAVLGEPAAVTEDQGRVWQKLLAARVVYLGEAERVVDSDDKLLELEIIRTLRDKCFEQRRPVSLAFDAFSLLLQPQLDQYMNKRLSDLDLKAYVSNWSDERWQEYLPMLQYCRNSGVRLIACGVPSEVTRTVLSEGVQALSKSDQQKYSPPIGGGFKFKAFPKSERSSGIDLLPKTSIPVGPGPYRFSQARVMADYTMAQVVTQVVNDGGSVGILIVITGASHVNFGSRGFGVPAWISKSLQKKTQAVILLNPERQFLRKEGDVPEADFLWYSAAKVCNRNCFDRAAVARVMGAAGRRPEALPQDIQAGLERGLISPEVLQNFFDLDNQPILAEFARRFQGLRERWLADPRFLQRLAIEEAISITTTLMAQYQRRGERFWKEIDYVATDTIRGAVVDFFTVWLPAPRLSFRALESEGKALNGFESLRGIIGAFPDNAFQRALGGETWGLPERVGAVIVGGLKLFGVGFVSSIVTLTTTNFILDVRKFYSKQGRQKASNKRSPVLKTAVVYASFLGTSANLRYQAIAGLVEHWVADYWLASQPFAGNVLSFVARTGNSYWGTQQWVDLARMVGLQAHNKDSVQTHPLPSIERKASVTVTISENSVPVLPSAEDTTVTADDKKLEEESVKVPKR